MQTLKHNSNVVVEQNVKVSLRSLMLELIVLTNLKPLYDIPEGTHVVKKKNEKRFSSDLGLQAEQISHKHNTCVSGIRYAMLIPQLGNVTPLLSPNNYICLLECLSRGRWLKMTAPSLEEHSSRLSKTSVDHLSEVIMADG